jgi:cytochrome P450
MLRQQLEGHMDGNPDSRMTKLDVSELRRTTLSEHLAGLLLRPWFFRLLRWIKPIARVPKGLKLVTRFDDVQELLSHDQIFQVEGARIKKANGGPNFLLGMQDDARCPFHQMRSAGTPIAHDRGRDSDRDPLTYREYQNLVMDQFRLEHLPGIGDFVERTARAELQPRTLNQATTETIEIDAIERLITEIPIAICEKYYGLTVRDRRDFANCAFAVSRWLFDPLSNSRFDSVGLAASERLNQLITAAIDGCTRTGTTVMDRCLREKVDPVIVRVVLFGMVVALVPTSTMAGGHILEMLLKHPTFLQRARAAADPAHGDDEQLKRCLFEAMRFKPLLREPLRVCKEPYTLAEGTGHAFRFKPGDRIIAFTASAMMDQRRIADPQTFDPLRPAHDYMLFGHGLHRCIGAPLAEVHITRTLKPLLQQTNLRTAPGKAGQLKTIGPFPEHLSVRFDA